MRHKLRCKIAYQYERAIGRPISRRYCQYGALNLRYVGVESKKTSFPQALSVTNNLKLNLFLMKREQVRSFRNVRLFYTFANILI